MSRRIVIGKRANGDLGVFIAPSGYDAYTALDSSLSISIHSKINSLLLIGYLDSSAYVPLGFGAKPFVLLSGLKTISSYYGITKPFPTFYGIGADRSYSYAGIASDGSGMTVFTSYRVRYEVYNEGGI